MLIPWEVLCENSAQSESFSEKLVEIAAADPLILSEVMRGVLHKEPCIQIQAADVVEKVSDRRPAFLMPYKRVILEQLINIELVDVRLQVALFLGRVLWDEWEMKQVVTLLEKWIEMQETEAIVINSLQSLHTLATQKTWIRPHLLEQLEKIKEHASVSVQKIAAELQV